MRRQPTADVAELLLRRSAEVSHSDSYVPVVCQGSVTLRAVPAEAALARDLDCAVIVTDHRGVEYAEIARRAPLVVDAPNAFRGIEEAHVFRLQHQRPNRPP